MKAIETFELSKRYGTRTGVLELNLEVNQGEVFGFLGPNGAGKSTTIRLLLGLLQPSAGQAKVMGQAAGSVAARQQTGYLAGELALYPQLSGMELLNHLASLRGGVERPYLQQLIERLQVDPSRAIRTLSKGNKQKLGLIQAFMHRPPLLILDEPTSGLDPLLQQEFAKLVQETAAEGRTVFLSSHVMAEAQSLCSRVGIIRQGRLVTVESVSQLHQRSLRRIAVRFEQAVPEGLLKLAGWQNPQVEGNELKANWVGSPALLLQALAQCQVVDFSAVEPSLEEMFLAHYQEVARA